MTHTQHDPDTELFAQGLGNTIAPFWGGIAATGAIARTATNIRFGAISPIASVFHAFCILITLLFFSDLLSFMPLAALAGLLIHVAWNMADIEHIKTIIKVGQFEDKVVFLTCFLTTVLFDMTIGVSIGVFLAMILFINRIIKQSSGRWIPNNELKNHSQNIDLPENSQLYVLEGQLFFGAAQKAISSLLIVDNNIKYIILDFTNVDDIDLTALTALYSSLQSLKSNHKICLMIHLKPNINKRIENFLDHHKLQDHVHILQNLQEVLKVIEKPF